MLKFDSLELLGFKSFADKTRVVFKEGLTAVVGPNGCGKSNLSDSIGWVLGLQTAHKLRGQRMDDVIFSGTRQRKPSGLCKVKLTVRAEGDTPLVLDGEELPGDKIEIARRLYRSGESTYMINGRRCRLKDIQRFIDESGLGFAPYAMIAQGKIASFLNARALERRAIIEEAAQISSYRSKRRSAEMKLELAEQNLVRVRDIISEVERQLRSLKRQANKARRYKNLKEEFEGLQRAKFVLESDSLVGRSRQLREEMDGLERTREELDGELSRREEAYRRSVAAREELEDELSKLRGQRSELRLELDRATNSRRYHQEQIESTRRQLDNNASERESLEKALRKVEADAGEFRRELENIEAQESEVREALDKQSARVEECARELQSAESRLEALRQTMVRLSSEAASLENQKDQLKDRLQADEHIRQRLEDERVQCRVGLEELGERLDRVREEESARQARLDELQTELQESREQRGEASRQLGELKSELQDRRSELIASRERLHSLQEVEISRSQYSEGVQKLLKHLNEQGGLQSGGTLADYIETHPDFERLVEEFLEDELEYVLVDSLDDAMKGVSKVRSLKTGKCTFMSLRSRSPNGANGDGQGGGDAQSLNGLGGEEGVFGTLGEILEMKPEVREAFQRVMAGRFGAVVVSDLDRALGLSEAHPQHTFITLAGEALEPSGLLSASAAQSKKLGLLSLKRQKREMEKKLRANQKSVAKAEARLAEREARLEELSQQCRRLDDSRQQAEKELVGLKHRLEQVQSDFDRQRSQLDRHEERIEAHDQEHDELKAKLGRIEAELQERCRQRAEAEGAMTEQRSALERLREEAEQARARLNDISMEGKVMQERRSALERTLARVAEQEQDLVSRLESGRRQREEGRKRMERMSAALQQLEKDMRRLRGEATEADEELRRKEGDFLDWKKSHPEIESKLAALRERKSQLQDERSRIEVELAKCETRLEDISSQCRESLNLSLEQAAEGVGRDELSLEEIVAPYHELKEKLERFGPINMTALQEYQENEERHGFLTGQRDDIEKSIADTANAIRDLNRRSREKFEDAFAAINGHFKTLFQKLFGGGDCGMRLLDEEDVLESGLDVFAQPPGKKLQHVSLLSGGEKALTGLALLMALFQYRPSRFCVLDEVDAPLDDANVARFCDLVREMSEGTQFIIITHNKRTMEIADALYGVTMEEPGVSQVVSVDF